MTREWRDLRPGDRVPADMLGPGEAPILGAACEPVWHVLVAMPQQEAALRAWLSDRGVDGWYPMVDRPTVRNGVAHVRRVPAVSGYVLGRWTGAPYWPGILACRHVARVVTHDERPVAVPDAEVARMADVPAVLIAIKMRDEAEEAARAARQRPVAGQPARIVAGIFAGTDAVPIHVAGNWVEFRFDLGVVKVAVQNVRRVGA